MTLRFIQVVGCFDGLCLFIAERYFIEQMYYSLSILLKGVCVVPNVLKLQIRCYKYLYRGFVSY